MIFTAGDNISILTNGITDNAKKACLLKPYVWQPVVNKFAMRVNINVWFSVELAIQRIIYVAK